eukprot:1194324-Prorocentrum_minimum.AAC.2
MSRARAGGGLQLDLRAAAQRVVRGALQYETLARPRRRNTCNTFGISSVVVVAVVDVAAVRYQNSEMFGRDLETNLLLIPRRGAQFT